MSGMCMAPDNLKRCNWFRALIVMILNLYVLPYKELGVLQLVYPTDHSIPTPGRHVLTHIPNHSIRCCSHTVVILFVLK